MRRVRPIEAANPYVALSDISIGLAFIFAICSIALSKSLDDVQRDQIQKRSLDLAESIVKQQPLPHRTIVDPEAKTPYDKLRNKIVEIHTGPGENDWQRFLRIQSNGSYQRINIAEAFQFGKAEITDQGRIRFTLLARSLKPYFKDRSDSYLYFHGITEPQEESIYGKIKITRDQFASLRAEAVYRIFVAEGLVMNNDTKPVIMPVGILDAKYAIPYGKSALYSEASPGNSEKRAGRVDLIIFTGDSK